MAMDEQKLLDYACVQFEHGEYDAALEAFILSYSKGYETERVLQNIYDCYMAGNEVEFQKNYEAWKKDGFPVEYNDCRLDFVPYREGEYYVFDKETRSFRGIFSTDDINKANRAEEFQECEFSAVAVDMNWDLRMKLDIVAEAKYRKVYVVCQDIEKCVSFFKLPELAGYAKNIMVFSDEKELQKYFHENTTVYLPKMFVGGENETKNLSDCMNEEHAYRLTPEGRNTDNVLLTIAIPTYNRGNLVLERVKNLLQMSYDAEIEIVVSKNGMELYQEEYQQVARIPDARLVYYDHGKTLIIQNNWRSAVSMSHGKYVLFVSDEDDVVLGALEHYLKLLVDFPEVNMVRAKTSYQYSRISNRGYGKKGLNAFARFFTLQPYISGLIVRREDFIKANLEYLEKFSDNAFYRTYPHEWWCAVLSQKGDNLTEPVLLIQEGESVEKVNGQMTLLSYATYEARIEQFGGMVEFLHWLMDKNTEVAAIGLWNAICKTIYLFCMVRETGYDREHFEDRLAQFCQKAVEAVEEFPLDKEQEIKILQLLQKEYLNALKKASDMK